MGQNDHSNNLKNTFPPKANVLMQTTKPYIFWFKKNWVSIYAENNSNQPFFVSSRQKQWYKSNFFFSNFLLFTPLGKARNTSFHFLLFPKSYYCLNLLSLVYIFRSSHYKSRTSLSEIKKFAHKCNMTPYLY